MTQSRASLIVAIVLLLLPVLYVGSYLALVVPRGVAVKWQDGGPHSSESRLVHYHVLNEDAGVFWPLEKIDRKLRPNAWIDVDNQW
jgi:hypothetical protein